MILHRHLTSPLFLDDMYNALCNIHFILLFIFSIKFVASERSFDRLNLYSLHELDLSSIILIAKENCLFESMPSRLLAIFSKVL